MDRVVPVVGVVRGGSVETAVVRLQRGMLPGKARVRVADDDPLSRVAHGPHLGRADLLEVRPDEGRRLGGGLRSRLGHGTLARWAGAAAREPGWRQPSRSPGAGRARPRDPRSPRPPPCSPGSADEIARLPRAGVRAAEAGSDPRLRAAPRRRSAGARPGRGSPRPRTGPPAPAAPRGAIGNPGSAALQSPATDPDPGPGPAPERGSRREGKRDARWKGNRSGRSGISSGRQRRSAGVRAAGVGEKRRRPLSPKASAEARDEAPRRGRRGASGCERHSRAFRK